MNAKKTLATLMVGVVAVSAMATVAVSAKAQKADECTWSTMAKESNAAETIVYVSIPSTRVDDVWQEDFGFVLQWSGASPEGAESVNDLEIIEIVKITNRKGGNASVEDEDLDRLYDIIKLKGGINATNTKPARDTKNIIKFTTGAVDSGADIEIAIKVKAPAGVKIEKNSIVAIPATDVIEETDGLTDETANVIVTAGAVFDTDDSANEMLGTTNVKKDASSKKVGVLLNMDTPDDAKAVRKDTILIKDLGWEIDKHMNPANDPLKKLEPEEEIADFIKDAKGATIAFNFEKKDVDESVSDKEFAAWVDRYDWNADGMKSAISLRINNSNVLSVDMMEFDKANFSAVYSWDEVMAKFQVGSATGLVNQMGLKINNDKLPAQKDDADKVIELRLASITVKIPELAETNDDTMVEDFAAGESATVVEDTLPAATDAPAADAPAATDAPATTDAADNPETGNSAAALLAIPAALAAAAIVAKKRG